MDLKDENELAVSLPPTNEDLTLRERQTDLAPNPEQPVDKKEEVSANGHELSSVKLARIVEDDPDSFGLEYDNTLGKKNVMRLEASSYEQALREAKSFLEIDANGQDANGVTWDIE